MYDLPITKKSDGVYKLGGNLIRWEEQGMEIEYFYTLNALPFIYKR